MTSLVTMECEKDKKNKKDKEDSVVVFIHGFGKRLHLAIGLRDRYGFTGRLYQHLRRQPDIAFPQTRHLRDSPGQNIPEQDWPVGRVLQRG